MAGGFFAVPERNSRGLYLLVPAAQELLLLRAVLLVPQVPLGFVGSLETARAGEQGDRARVLGRQEPRPPVHGVDHQVIERLDPLGNVSFAALAADDHASVHDPILPVDTSGFQYGRGVCPAKLTPAPTMPRPAQPG